MPSGLGSLAGTIFEDTNSNGLLDAGEPVQGGYTVQLFKNGALVATTTSLADGSYLFLGIEPGSGYTIAATSPDGTMIAGQGSFSIAAGQNITDVDLPIDPSGVVYDAVTRLPVAGALLQLTTAAGAPLPPVCFVSPTQQGQITGAGRRLQVRHRCRRRARMPRRRDGIPSRGDVAARLILPELPPPFLRSPVRSNPADCAVDPSTGGSCQVQPQAGAPAAGASTVYFLSFLVGRRQPGHGSQPHPA